MGAIEIAATLAASRRAVRLYPPEHPTHREALSNLVFAVNASVDIRPLVLNLREGHLYEGSSVITDSSPATRALAQAMEARRIESMTFHMGFGHVDGEGISEVLSLRPSPELEIQAELDARGVKAVSVSELEDNSARTAEERDRQREADRALFRRMLSGLDAAREALVAGNPIEASDLTRAIAPFIERIRTDHQAMLALAQMTGHGDRSRFHAAGVMLVSMVMGKELGLSDHQLLDLGLAAMLHDIGFTLMPDGDTDEVRASHPAVGARGAGPMADEGCATLRVAFEHHMGVDGSGWPKMAEGYVMHPYSRIVAVADRYDKLIKGDEGPGVRPDEAVSQVLRDASAGSLDPLVARVLAIAAGVLPAGCVVRLSDMSVGIVSSVGGNAFRPTLRLVLSETGSELRPPRDLDLADSELAIVEVLRPEFAGIQPSDYL